MNYKCGGGVTRTHFVLLLVCIVPKKSRLLGARPFNGASVYCSNMALIGTAWKVISERLPSYRMPTVLSSIDVRHE